MEKSSSIYDQLAILISFKPYVKLNFVRNSKLTSLKYAFNLPPLPNTSVCKPEWRKMRLRELLSSCLKTRD